MCFIQHTCTHTHTATSVLLVKSDRYFSQFVIVTLIIFLNVEHFAKWSKTIYAFNDKLCIMLWNNCFFLMFFAWLSKYRIWSTETTSMHFLLEREILWNHTMLLLPRILTCFLYNSCLSICNFPQKKNICQIVKC